MHAGAFGRKNPALGKRVMLLRVILYLRKDEKKRVKNKKIDKKKENNPTKAQNTTLANYALLYF